MKANNALIVGLGFGQAVYKPVLTRLGYNVITVDLKEGADFSTISDAVEQFSNFEITHICTPNFTHNELARQAAPYSKIVFVEKPGVANHSEWHNLVKDFDARIAMVKNNQYRDDIARFKYLANESSKVVVRWDSKNRVPNPGSWFTNKKFAFGGVSRDLIPHMLSYYTTMTDYHNGSKKHVVAAQNHDLTTIETTDYGVVNKEGIYDVDDFCMFEFVDNNGIDWTLSANWKNDKSDDSSITFFLKKGEPVKFDLGLCPEVAYEKMIVTAVENLNNDKFWKNQYEQDMWIHRQIEQI